MKEKRKKFSTNDTFSLLQQQHIELHSNDVKQRKKSFVGKSSWDVVLVVALIRLLIQQNDVVFVCKCQAAIDMMLSLKNVGC